MDTYKSGLQTMDIVPASDKTAGDFTTLHDGLPGYVLPGNTGGIDVSLRDEGAKQIHTIAKVAKTASIVFLAGQRVYMDRATGLATYDYRGNDFLGVAVAQPGQTSSPIVAAGSGSYVYVLLGRDRKDIIEQGKTGFDMTVVANATSTQLADGTWKLLFTTAGEAQKAVFISEDGIDVDDGPIMEAWFASFVIGDNAAYDFDIGLASADDADSFEDIAAFISLHLDNALDLNAQSDDSVTDIAAVDTTINLVDDTWVFMQICLVDKTAPIVLVNGIQITAPTTLTMAGYSGDLKAIAHMEKTSDDSPGEVRVRRMCAYCAK